MLLTDTECRNLKPSAKTYKKSDGQGLFLEIRPNGARYWRLKYRYLNKEKKLGLGVRQRIPADLIESYGGKKEIVKSLKTTDHAQAKRSARISAVIVAIRRKSAAVVCL